MAEAKSTAHTCNIEGCERPAYCKGWCHTHYDRSRRGGDLTTPIRLPKDEPDVCCVDGCGRLLTPPYGRGMCSLHYQRWRKHGDPSWEPKRGRSDCTIRGCDKPVVGDGWCSKHYTRARRYGDPTYRIPGEVVDGKRICPRCGVDTPLEEWGSGYCLRCCAERKRERYWSDPESAREANKKYGDRRRARLAGAEMGKFKKIDVFERDGWVCGICGDAVDSDLSWPDPMSATLDHIQPLSLGGAHSYENAQCAHLHCNCSKGNRVA